MIVAAHQPNYLPWIGYFYKLWRADCMVVLDNVQYSKNSYQNRNRIKTARGPTWLTVPVVTAGRLGQPIDAVEIVPDSGWHHSHLGSIRQHYRHAPYFHTYFPALTELCERPWIRLVELNLALIRLLAASLDIHTPLCLASEMGVDDKGTDMLVDLCRKTGATCYLSGFGGRSYQDPELMRAAGIKLHVYDFRHPVYPQLWGDFVSQLSVIDLLFNCGPASAQVIRNSASEGGDGCGGC